MNTTPPRSHRLSCSAPDLSTSTNLQYPSTFRVSASIDDCYGPSMLLHPPIGKLPAPSTKTHTSRCAGSPLSFFPWKRAGPKLHSLMTSTSPSQVRFNSCNRTKASDAMSNDISHVLAYEDKSNAEGIDQCAIGQVFEQEDALFPISTQLMTTKGNTISPMLEDDDMESAWWYSMPSNQSVLEADRQIIGYVSNDSSPVQREFEKTIMDAEIEPVIVCSESDVPIPPTLIDPMAVDMLTLLREGKYADEHIETNISNTLEEDNSDSVHKLERTVNKPYLNAISKELAQQTAQRRNSDPTQSSGQISAAPTSLRALIAGKKRNHSSNNNITLLLMRPNATTTLRLNQSAARISLQSNSGHSVDIAQNENTQPTDTRIHARKRRMVTVDDDCHSNRFDCCGPHHCGCTLKGSSLHHMTSIEVKVIVRGLQWGSPLSALVTEGDAPVVL